MENNKKISMAVIITCFIAVTILIGIWIHLGDFTPDITPAEVYKAKCDSLQEKYNKDIAYKDSILYMDSVIISEQSRIINTTKLKNIK